MTIIEHIESYITSLPIQKANDLRILHELCSVHNSTGKYWFLDGKNAAGKVISNPNIGYGSYLINYANGNQREFYQIGLSANTSGISIYIMGLNDKNLLKDTFGQRLGKATISGYCIKFKQLNLIDKVVLEEILLLGFKDKSDLDK